MWPEPGSSGLEDRIYPFPGYDLPRATLPLLSRALPQQLGTDTWPYLFVLWDTVRPDVMSVEVSYGGKTAHESIFFPCE